MKRHLAEIIAECEMLSALASDPAQKDLALRTARLDVAYMEHGPRLLALAKATMALRRMMAFGYDNCPGKRSRWDDALAAVDAAIDEEQSR